MAMRTTRSKVTFTASFNLPELEAPQPAGTYKVETDEEIVEGNERIVYIRRATLLYLVEQAPPAVREIAWKAQSRLSARYRALSARGKKTTVIFAAVARELVGFMWCIARQAQPG